MSNPSLERRPSTEGALPGRATIAVAAFPGKVPSLGGPALERRVRRRFPPVGRLSSLRSKELTVVAEPTVMPWRFSGGSASCPRRQAL
jgi:hypothetical protein